MANVIVTKRLPATNTRGQRVKATLYSGSVTISWDFALDGAGNHRHAAEALATRFAILGQGHYLIGGMLPRGDGYAFVVTER